MPQIDLFEIMYSAGSIRRLRPDPVPDEIIAKVLDAAIRALTSAGRLDAPVHIDAFKHGTSNTGASPICSNRCVTDCIKRWYLFSSIWGGRGAPAYNFTRMSDAFL